MLSAICFAMTAGALLASPAPSRFDDRPAPFVAGTARSEAQIAEELRDRLKEAVHLRLISDVPLGVFLSGGIDSSTVVALMAELRSAAQIKTFAIGFEDSSFDESKYARRVAAFYGTDHREDILQPRALLDMLPEVAAFLDEPFADASIIPTYLLSKFTRRHVTVALGGDGAYADLRGTIFDPANCPKESECVITVESEAALAQPRRGDTG
jgi:asparagine synthase (glutamine-hydrolysing)